jgi:hypothetical protein
MMQDVRQFWAEAKRLYPLTKTVQTGCAGGRYLSSLIFPQQLPERGIDKIAILTHLNSVHAPPHSALTAAICSPGLGANLGAEQTPRSTVVRGTPMPCGDNWSKFSGRGQICAYSGRRSSLPDDYHDFVQYHVDTPTSPWPCSRSKPKTPGLGISVAS